MDNRRNVKEFTHTWKIEQLRSSLSQEYELWSPKTYVSATNWLKFHLDSIGSDSASKVIRISIHASPNLDFSLVNCDLTVDDVPGANLGFVKIRCLDLPGWKFHWNFSLERESYDHFDFCVRLFVGESVIQRIGQEIELRKLSRDMCNLLRSSDLSDLTVKTRSGDFKTHRAVLSARCPELLRILRIKENGPSSSSHVFYTVSAKVFKILLNYFYNGKLNINRMEVGLKNAIDTLMLDDLKSQLCAYPTSSTTMTRVRTSIHSVIWPIKDIKRSLPTKVFISPVFQPSNLGTLQLMLRLQTVVDSSDVNVSVRLHPDFATTNYRINLKTAIVNAYEELTQVRSFAVDSQPDWNEVLLLKNEENDDVLQEDSLTFYCEITIHHTLHEVTENVYSNESLEDQASLCHDLTNLSDSLTSLYVSGKFSDLQIEASGRKFKVHKAILSTRAPKLFSVIQGKMGFGQTTCTFEDEDPDVLNTLFLYIYSARVDVSNSGEATKLYLVADKYEFGLLKKSCLAYIKSNIIF